MNDAKIKSPDTLSRVVVIGGSAGGKEALGHLLRALPTDFPAGIAVVLHIHPHSEIDQQIESLKRQQKISICEAREKDRMVAGKVYLAPANYHLLFEPDGRFALNIDPKVNFSRPSIDVLFQSAADVFGSQLIGILLSGASKDGAEGLAQIKKAGGSVLIQDPETASSSYMPQTALKLCGVEEGLAPEIIGKELLRLIEEKI